MKQDHDAWSGLEGKSQSNEGADAGNMELCRSFARLFTHHESAKVLEHLRKSTRERVFGPEVSEATLRYVEGQRALVAYIENMIERGKASALQPGK